jgi:hypothetical protein
MHINKYLPFALLYFFLNSLGLPFGLTYTALLAPVFYFWILNTRKKEVLLPFLLAMFPLVFMQVNFVGVDTASYIISLLNLLAVYIFCQAVYTFLRSCQDPERIFKVLLFINFILCLIAIPFYFTGYSEIFWIKQPLTEGINDFRRLRLFTYEASYYATLLVPVFFFFFLKIILKQNKTNAWVLLMLLVLPYILSFSIGVISAILISTTIVSVVYFRRIVLRKRVVSIAIIFVTVLVPLIAALMLWYPENTLFVRLSNIASGLDKSGRGRTFEAFYLAMKIIALKSEIWGIGVGQIKIIGTEIIRDFYLYPMDYRIAIPNVTAETLALFGWVGLLLRFVAEVFLFFFTQVWKNYYRLLLFLFMFIYQFTGSFITNVAEYVIWVFAFTEVFPQFLVSDRLIHKKLLF